MISQIIDQILTLKCFLFQNILLTAEVPRVIYIPLTDCVISLQTRNIPSNMMEVYDCRYKKKTS